MKNIAICYREHAIKVSDSYCSGPSNQVYSKSSSPQLNSLSIQNAVASVYKVKLLNEKQFLIRLTWYNPLTFSIRIFDQPFSTSKFSKTFRYLRKQRGEEKFESDGQKIEVFWDLCRVKYETGPEPVSGYYVLVSVDSEPALILGDMENELEVKKRVFQTRFCESSLISRSEYFSGSSVYSTRAKFCETGKHHEISIRREGDRKAVDNPVLTVCIDNKSVVEVKRLRWNFRGNQTIFVDGLLVDLMWDVREWFFGNGTKGYAVFLFRTRRGLDSNRLWLEEKSIDKKEMQEKVGFSFLICACKIPD